MLISRDTKISKGKHLVETDKIGIFGYSRGAMATSLMLPRIKDVKAAISRRWHLRSEKAYDELTTEGIK